MAENKNRKIYFSILVTLLLLIFFHYVGWLNWFERLVRSGVTNVLVKAHIWNVDIQKKSGDSNVKAVCQNEYDQIIFWQKENEISNARLKILEQENNDLKNILNFSKQQPGYKVITASVIGKNTENIERTIAISLGMNSGVRNGQSVVVLDGILIGKIVKVEPDLSWVRLINDNNSKIAATILNAEKSQGVVEGGYGLSVSMNFIPRNEKVSVGESVITSGLDSSVPKGLLLGTVAAVVNEAYQPFQKAVLNPAVDLSKLTIVGVLIDDKL